MSFSTLQCCKTTQYHSKAFPRVSEFQQKLASFKKPIKFTFDAVDAHLRWIWKPKDPTLIFYVSTNSGQIDTSEFAVKVPTGKILTTTDMPQGFDPPEPFAVLCILQSNEDGSLTSESIKISSNQKLTPICGHNDNEFNIEMNPDAKMQLKRLDEDKIVLSMIRVLPDKCKDHCVFVTYSQSLSNETLQSLSEAIGLELKNDSDLNEIFHRLFPCHSSEIPIRLSLYLEKQLLKRIKSEKKTIQQNLEDTRRIEITLNDNNFYPRYKQTLQDIFEPESCQNFLRIASMKYVCPDENTRKKWKVDEVKMTVAHLICEELGQTIAKKLIKQFSLDLEAMDLKLANYLLQHVDVSNIEQSLFLFIFQIIATILGPVIEIANVIFVFFFSESLNSETFRHKIADTVFEQISKNKHKIILEVLTEFNRAQLDRILVFKRYLRCVDDILLMVEDAKLETQNMTDCRYHELKIVAKRNKMIRAIGYVHGELSVFAQNVEENRSLLQMYLSKCLKNANQISIREYTNISINKFAFQSGDKLLVPPMNSRHQKHLNLSENEKNSSHGNEELYNRQGSGDRLSRRMSHATVGFYLCDTLGHTYAATCRHAIVGLKDNEVTVCSSVGTKFKSDFIYTPSDQLDFTVIRLDMHGRNYEDITTGIRNKHSGHAYGKIFERDTFTLINRTEVYMWGAESGLTTGLYAATIEVFSSDESEDNDGKSYPFFYIENKDSNEFAKPGDSGSLISYESENGVVAAFMFIGRDEANHSFVCNRIIDGISMVERIIPNISHLLSDDND